MVVNLPTCSRRWRAHSTHDLRIVSAARASPTTLVLRRFRRSSRTRLSVNTTDIVLRRSSTPALYPFAKQASVNARSMPFSYSSSRQRSRRWRWRSSSDDSAELAGATSWADRPAPASSNWSSQRQVPVQPWDGKRPRASVWMRSMSRARHGVAGGRKVGVLPTRAPVHPAVERMDQRRDDASNLAGSVQSVQPTRASAATAAAGVDIQHLPNLRGFATGYATYIRPEGFATSSTTHSMWQATSPPSAVPTTRPTPSA